jgi:hypothetical protein
LEEDGDDIRAKFDTHSSHLVLKRQFYKPSRIGDMFDSELESDERPIVVLKKWKNSEKSDASDAVMNRISSFFKNVIKQIKEQFAKLSPKA